MSSLNCPKYQLPHHTVKWQESDYIKADINEKINSIQFHESKINVEKNHIENRKEDIKKLLLKLDNVKEDVQ